MYKGLVKLEG